nr:TolC family protein [Pseudomonadota bacterium]
MRRLNLGHTLILLALLPSCEVGPSYKRPSVETTAAYKEFGDWKLAQPHDVIDRGAWWSIYNDALLDHLEAQVDVSNQNLKAAEAAYRQASAVVEETRATLFPSLTLNGSAVGSGSPDRSTTKPSVTTYSANASASWVPDVWGRIRRSVESDQANAEATLADLGSARLSAQALLATDYFELRLQDVLKDLLSRTVHDDEKILKIVQNQYNAGVVSKADVLT